MDACERLGVDVDLLLKAVGVERQVLQDADARLPATVVQSLWKKAYELAGDSDLALHAVEALPFGAYKVVDFMAVQAPTVGAAFSGVSEYFPIINTAVSLPIEIGEREVSFGIAHEDGGPVSRPYAEYTFAACYLRVRQAMGDFPLKRVEFTHEAPASTTEHERVFGCSVHFGASKLQMVMTRQVWERPSARPNTELYAVLREHAKLLIERLPSGVGLAQEVRAAISQQLSAGNPTLEGVAKQLGVGARTLQRRLKDEGLSFAQVLDEVRAVLAELYLRDRELAISEISFLLGFSEQSAFNRAFRRWNGTTPAEARRRLS